MLARILDFGTIAVIGTGGSKEPFHRIADPLQFRRKVQEQAAVMEDWRNARPSAEQGNPIAQWIRSAEGLRRSSEMVL